MPQKENEILEKGEKKQSVKETKIANGNKRPSDLNGHLSIRDSTPISCQRAHICISTAPS